MSALRWAVLDIGQPISSGVQGCPGNSGSLSSTPPLKPLKTKLYRKRLFLGRVGGDGPSWPRLSCLFSGELAAPETWFLPTRRRLLTEAETRGLFPCPEGAPLLYKIQRSVQVREGVGSTDSQGYLPARPLVRWSLRRTEPVWSQGE